VLVDIALTVEVGVLSELPTGKVLLDEFGQRLGAEVRWLKERTSDRAEELDELSEDIFPMFPLKGAPEAV
jgi:hypothetical protein